MVGFSDMVRLLLYLIPKPENLTFVIPVWPNAFQYFKKVAKE
jgi:hypothetical protein